MNRINKMDGNRRAILALIGTIGLTVLSIAAAPPNTTKGQPQSPLNIHVGPGDWPQLGGTPLRNNASNGTSIPRQWDINTGKNIKWSANLGSQTFGNVVIGNGQIYVGTNNGAGYLKRYPSKVDLGVLLCFRETDGEFHWQHSTEKHPTGRIHDWPQIGICSSPVVEDERLWFVTNRGEVVCLDTKGFYDGEDDGQVVGVWKPYFEVIANLADWTAPSKSPFSSSEFEHVLKSLVSALDTKFGTQYFFKRTTQRNVWAAISFNNNPLEQRTLFHVAFQQKSIIITGLDGDDHEIRIDSDLIEGLDDGRLSFGLQLLFKSKGLELPQTAKPTVTESGKTWQLTTIVAGNPTTFQIEKKMSTLVCEMQVVSPEKTEADVIWKFNMMQELGVQQHNMATCAPTIWGNVLFVCTSNGVDEGHQRIPNPDAPSFVAIDKNSGKVLWTDNSPGQNIMHGQWSCPAVGVFDGVQQAVFPGGDGWLYSFRADRWNDGKPEPLWKFDGNPKNSKYQLGGRSTRNGIIAVPVIHDTFVYLAMGEDPEHGEGQGHLWCIDPTKRGDVSAELVVDGKGLVLPHQRIRANASPVELFQLESDEWEKLDLGQIPQSFQTQFLKVGMPLPQSARLVTGTPGQKWDLYTVQNGHERKIGLSVSHVPQIGLNRLIVARLYGKVSVVANPNSAVVWHYTGQDIDEDGKLEFEETMHRTLGSPVIKNDLLVITDFSGVVHCLNSKTGRLHWTHDSFDAEWGTPLIVDGHVYCITEMGDMRIFELSKTKKVVGEVQMGDSIHTMPVVANNVLYIANRNGLFAISAGANGPRRKPKIKFEEAE